MSKGLVQRRVYPTKPEQEGSLKELFVGVGLVVFPAVVLVVAAAQLAMQQPHLVMRLIGLE